mmetsp:Transcript_28590/g.47400  ORF Transcript_28590/g.47400 Transcript_28590/m.47400 type:complete len:249 (+) Transcript_28590:3-749(+)
MAAGETQAQMLRVFGKPFGISQRASLRFIVLLREPIARALSSVRMMRQWRWERRNQTGAIRTDVEALNQCGQVMFAPSDSSRHVSVSEILPKISYTGLQRYRTCLANGAPLNHVRAGVYAASALAWLRAFEASQFLWLETEKIRGQRSEQLLATLARFAGLPLEHLGSLPSHMRAACERRSSEAKAGSVDARMLVHGSAQLDELAKHDAALLNRTFLPFNMLLATLLVHARELKGVAWLAYAATKTGK